MNKNQNSKMPSVQSKTSSFRFIKTNFLAKQIKDLGFESKTIFNLYFNGGRLDDIILKHKDSVDEITEAVSEDLKLWLKQNKRANLLYKMEIEKFEYEKKIEAQRFEVERSIKEEQFEKELQAKQEEEERIRIIQISEAKEIEHVQEAEIEHVQEVKDIAYYIRQLKIRDNTIADLQKQVEMYKTLYAQGQKKTTN